MKTKVRRSGLESRGRSSKTISEDVTVIGGGAHLYLHFTTPHAAGESNFQIGMRYEALPELLAAIVDMGKWAVVPLAEAAAEAARRAQAPVPVPHLRAVGPSS